MRLIALLAAFFAPATNAAAAQLWLTMDQVRPYEIETPAARIVVGNPAIADVTVLENSKILLFGKSPGLTNIFLFDEAGRAIDELSIRVGSADNRMVVFHRGSVRTTLTCASQCEPTNAVGDDVVVFGNITTQAQQKLQQASGGLNQ